MPSVISAAGAWARGRGREGMDIEQPSVRRRQAPAGGPQGSNAGPQAGAAATARGQELTLSTQESRFDPFDSDALANLGIPYLGFMASDQPAGLRATVGGGLQSAGNARRRHRPSSATACVGWTKLPGRESTSIQINHLQPVASEQDYRGQPAAGKPPGGDSGTTPCPERHCGRGFGRAAAR